MIRHIDLSDDNSTCTGFYTNDYSCVEKYLKDNNVFSRKVYHTLSKYDSYTVLSDLRVVESKKGLGLGKEKLKNFITLNSADVFVLIADTYEDNFIDLIEWYKRYGFETITHAHAGPLMIYESSH